MFCKWCGADIPNSSTKCTRCGKDVPAMSDCGGFYDLIPNAKRTTIEGTVSQPIPPQVAPVRTDPIKNGPPQKDAHLKGKKSNGRKYSGFQLVVTCTGFVIVIALLLSLNGKLGDSFSKIDDINGRINTIYTELHQINETIMPSEENQATPPTGEGIPDEVFLDEQDVRIEINVEYTEVGSNVKTTANLGEFDDAVVHEVSFDKDNHSISAVQIDLSEAKNCIDIEIENILSKTTLREGMISVVFDIEEDVFAERIGDEEYEWEYRIGGTAEWKTLDNNIFTMSPNGTAVNYVIGDLEDLFDEAEIVEFRVSYKRANTKNGSLTIIISGITVTKQTLEVRSNTYK